MNMETSVQIKDKVVKFSLGVNTFGKGNYPTILRQT